MGNPIPHAVSLLFQFALLLLAIVASVVACGRLIRSKAGQAVPVPLLTATVWLVPCALLWMARLPWFHNARDARDLGLIVPVAFVLGGLFGLCFMLRPRWGKASAGWAQRTWVGAAFGLVLALLIGVVVHNVLTGWGFRSHVLLLVALTRVCRGGAVDAGAGAGPRAVLTLRLHASGHPVLKLAAMPAKDDAHQERMRAHASARRTPRAPSRPMS